MARTIKIENKSGATKTWIGQLLADDEMFDIPERLMTKWANNSTVITDVASGDLKLVKSEGPTVYYTAAEGQRVLDGLDPKLAGDGSSGELLCTNPSGNLVWTSIVGGTISFMNDKVTSNKWLTINGTPGSTSDITPAVIPFNAVIFGLAFTNTVNSSDIDLEIHKNGTLLFTWEIRTKRHAYKTNGLSAVTFSAGDTLSVYAKDVAAGIDPDDPVVHIHYSFTDGTTGEGGSATL